MNDPPNPKMMMFHIPKDRELLATLGEITLCHSHLDYILRMTIKSLASVGIKQALDATTRDGSRVLRQRIGTLARRRLGEGNALIQLQALLERCARATCKRNNLVHNIWAQELDGDAKVRSPDHSWEPIPAVAELRNLSVELSRLTDELNDARLHGFLAEAIAQSEKRIS